MELKAKLINLDQWEVSGGGGNGLSYNNKEDDSIILKMNKSSLPEEHTVIEYQKSEYLYGMGLKCPKVFEFVTDGERYGYIVEKVKNKKSFARIISEDPGQLESVAVTFAHETLKLHQIRCDSGLIPSYRDTYLENLSQCSILSSKEKSSLRKALEAMDDGVCCIHGDLNPGNMICAGGENYWIDLGDVMFGDPDLDIANMMFIAWHIPTRVIESLFHFRVKEFRKFVEKFSQEYYGELWGTRQLDEKLQNALLLKAGSVIFKKPKAAFFYRPFINGRMFAYNIRMGIMNAVVRKYGA